MRIDRSVCICIVHGGWTGWSVSTLCSVTCGSGVEILSRTCTNPAPKYGGRSCQGDAQKQQRCTKKPCPSTYLVYYSAMYIGALGFKTRGRVLPYKSLMGTCGQPGYVFRDFCLKQGIEFIIFCLNQGIDLSILS